MRASLFFSARTLFVVMLTAAAVGTALGRTVDDADIGDAVDSRDAAKVTAPRDRLPSFIRAGNVPRLQAQSDVRLLSAPGVRPVVMGAVYKVPSEEPQPGVLVLHGSGGLSPAYHAYAADLSSAGYVVLLIDYFADTGPAEAGSDARLAAWPTWEHTVRKALDYLRQQPGVDSDRLGVVGFSRGAWLAFTTLGNAPDVRAIVNYYGVGTQPLNWQAQGPAVLMFYGQQDQFADPTFVSKVAAGLRTAGRTSDVKVYDGAGHGFNFVAGSSPAMRLATGDAGRRTREFLARYLR